MKNLFVIFVPLALFVILPIAITAQNDIAFSRDLPEATVVAINIPHIAYDNKVVSVKDFEINEKGIYLIAQRRRNNAILHLNFNCDTLKELKISPAYYNIFKDVFGEMHIISNDDVWQIGHKTFKNRFFEMELMYRTPLNNFLKAFKNVACATDSVIVSGRYFFSDQEIYYYYFKINGDQSPVLLHHVVNQEGRDLYFNVRIVPDVSTSSTLSSCDTRMPVPPR